MTAGHALRWPVGIVVLVVLVGVAWWVTNSSAFDVRTLRVEGNTHLSSDDVVRLASLTDNTNVLWMSTKEVERRLERDPWIRSADVSRTLPSAVAISVRERWPVAILRGRSHLMVAGDGTVLGKAGPRVRLPLIDPPGRHRMGSPVHPSDARLSVARALSPDLRELVATVSVGAGSSTTLELRSGVRVLFGEPSGAPAKVEALRSVLAWAVRHGVSPEYVDVRIAAVPAIMPGA
jgi:cell division protein FtsQ